MLEGEPRCMRRSATLNGSGQPETQTMLALRRLRTCETTCLTINGLWRKQCYGIFMCDGSGMFRVRSLIYQIVHSGFGPVVLQLYREPLKDESQASITQNQISSWWYFTNMDQPMNEPFFSGGNWANVLGSSTGLYPSKTMIFFALITGMYRDCVCHSDEPFTSIPFNSLIHTNSISGPTSKHVVFFTLNKRSCLSVSSGFFSKLNKHQLKKTHTHTQKNKKETHSQ